MRTALLLVAPLLLAALALPTASATIRVCHEPVDVECFSDDGSGYRWCDVYLADHSGAACIVLASILTPA